MVDILFINPPLVDYDSFKKPKVLAYTSFFPPIGLAYLSSILEKHNFKTYILDMDAEKFGLSKINDIIKIIKPKVIGIGITSDLVYPVSYRLIKQINKNNLNKIPIVIGGLFPSKNPIYLIKKPEIDYIVRGEGEETILELMNFLINKKGELNQIKGLTYKLNGEVINNPRRDLIKNLDMIPFPAWHKFSIKKYFISIAYKNPSFAMTASRGCVHRCVFCSTSVFQYHRLRSPKNVVDEMEYLINRFNIKDITFHDPTFNINPKWVIQICKEILRRKIKIKWRCLCRVDNITERLIAYMKTAGCYCISFGIESSKDKFLDFLQKDFTIHQVETAMKIVHKYRIETLAYFVYGIPGQKISDLKHNLKFIKKLNPDYINVLILNPVTETKLYDMAIKEGWLKEINFESFESPERIGVLKKWWNIPNFNEEILNYYIRKTYILFFFRFKTIIKYSARYIKNPSRILNAIKNIIHRFIL